MIGIKNSQYFETLLFGSRNHNVRDSRFTNVQQDLSLKFLEQAFYTSPDVNNRPRCRVSLCVGSVIYSTNFIPFANIFAHQFSVKLKSNKNFLRTVICIAHPFSDDLSSPGDSRSSCGTAIFSPV